MTGNEKEFEKILFRLLEDPEKIEQMGTAALEVVRENQGGTRRNIDLFEKLAKKYNIKLMEKPHES